MFHLKLQYDALNLGEPGSGGEYADQEGFGWTNGLVLDLLERYGDVLISDFHGTVCYSQIAWFHIQHYFALKTEHNLVFQEASHTQSNDIS